jgi:flagellar biosynthesis/type III secretory pathway M-ring protein FliF/YscJ
VIRDLVAGVTGFDAARGDQLIVVTLPFETTLMSEPPQPQAPAPVTPAPLPIPLPLDQRTMYIAGGVLVLLLLMVAGGLRFRRPRSKPAVEATGAPALPGGEMSAPAATQLETGPTVEQQLEAKLAERDALQRRMESQALNMLNIAPPITKTAEVLAKHLREKIKEEPAVAAHILQSWIREEDN